MADINLLPWREERRDRKNREFRLVGLFAAVLAVAIAFAVWSYFNNELNDQYDANNHITEQNKALDKQLTEIETLEGRREAIVSRMRVIQDLQGRRPVPVRVWYDVANALPQALYLNVFQREGSLLSFTGRADNPNVVSSLVRNLNASDWLENSKVKFIKQDVSAYETTTANTLNGGSTVAPPESDYIDFVVTTQIVDIKGEASIEPATDANKAGE